MAMEVRSYQDLDVWQKAMDLAAEAYRATRDFPPQERLGMTSQIRRAAASVAVNTAERHARPHTREFLTFVGVAAGSLAEL